MRRTVRGHSFPLSNNRERKEEEDSGWKEKRREKGRRTNIFVPTIRIQYVIGGRNQFPSPLRPRHHDENNSSILFPPSLSIVFLG